MANYKESSGTTTTWQRAHHIAISNKFNKPVGVTFAEESATLVNGTDFFSKDAGDLSKVITNYAEQYPLRNPIDNSLLGGFGDYQILNIHVYSAYVYEAEQRDLRNAQQNNNV